MPDHPLLARALDALVVPLPEGHLATALGLHPGSRDARSVVDELVTGGRVVHLGDGRVGSGEALLDGLVLWHRVDAVEVAMRRVSLGIDVLPALEVVPDRRDVHVGDDLVPLMEWLGPGDPDLDRGPTLRLPEGWGHDLAAGDLVALTLDGLRFRLHRADDPLLPEGSPAGVAEADALGASLRHLAATRGAGLSMLRDPDHDTADQWVIDVELQGGILLADVGSALRDLHHLPLREAIVRAGCSSTAGMVAGPGVSSQALDTLMVGWTVAAGISADDTKVLEACGIVVGALCGPESSGGDSAGAARSTAHVLRTMLADPLVAQLIVGHLRNVHLGVAAEAERRLRKAHRDDPTVPGLAWARATVLLRQGRSREAADILDRAVARFDATTFAEWPLLVRGAAQVRSLQGDLVTAADLMRRSKWHAEAAQLTAAQPRPPRVGRNEACPCGSGAKAKTCCLRTPPAPPVVQRLPLLWQKLASWAIQEDCGTSQAADLAGRVIDLTDPAALVQAQSAHDVHLLDGGGLGTVLDEVGMLLPDDEYEVAMRWRFGRHAVWVVEHDDESSPVWCDAVTSARARVVGTLEPETTVPSAPPGTHLLAPLLPGPTGHHLVRRAVPVPPADVERACAMVGLGGVPLMALLWELQGVGIGHAWPDAA